MKRVVLIGFDPTAVDFSDPALPPGMTAEKIHAGIKLALTDFAERGWHPENCFINPTILLSQPLNVAWPLTSTTV